LAGWYRLAKADHSSGKPSLAIAAATYSRSSAMLNQV
jgi:hypothetical protein